MRNHEVILTLYGDNIGTVYGRNGIANNLLDFNKRYIYNVHEHIYIYVAKWYVKSGSNENEIEWKTKSAPIPFAANRQHIVEPQSYSDIP